MASFLHQLRRVKFKEIRDIWKLPISFICAPIYRIRHKDLWIICEDRNEARDNGYWLFKYLRKQHPDQECVYAISKKSPDYGKVRTLGKTVEFGSLQHWILYFASSKKISSQKAGNPNAAIFYFLEVYGILRDKRIFLQHGVIKDDLKWLYYDVTKMNRFICGAYPEYEYIKNNFGYPEGNVCYTGLCRFDGWHDRPEDERMILIMPTWREWIADEDYRLKQLEGTTEIPKTNYFTTWIDFIKDKRIEDIATKYNLRFIFYPHRSMQKYMGYFPKSNKYIEIVSANDYDIQILPRSAAMMVTDYSSVFFDMLYMKKPIVYYQFDYEKFRLGQYTEGYFDYKNNPFGKSFEDKDNVFDEIEYYVCKDFKVGEEYLDAHPKYFPLYDRNNCERVYQVVRNL